MIPILFIAALFATLGDIDDIPAEVREEARRATFGKEQPIGFSQKDLSLWRYRCRMPAFDGWIEDVFSFEAVSRSLGSRFVQAEGAAMLVQEGWTAGGFELADEAGPDVIFGDAFESIELMLKKLHEHTGNELPIEEIKRTAAQVPARIREPLIRFLAALPSCRYAWDRAIENVGFEDADMETKARWYFREGADRNTLNLIEKQFNRAWAGRAAVDFVRAVEILADAVRKARLSARTPDVRIPTPYGEIWIGSRAKSEHGDQPPLLLIDVSGDDRYLPGSACGRGRQTFCAVIDVRGDDVYEATDEIGKAGAGAGVGGIGIVVDLAGDDHYLANRFGAGFAALGAGVILDRAGKDTYVGEQECQAFGFCGVGLILDEKGDDQYELFYQGQGIGLPMGAGLLVDLEGDDRYVARDDDLRYPSPQTKEHNTSMAQGVGYGLRDDENKRYVSGGFGLLLDHEGNDAYQGGVFAQAAGYWYGFGMLLDLAGDDTYRAAYYGQSASAHFALSYLLDADGNDDYRTDLSQSLGNGRDLSISIFRDEKGDDRYFAPDRSLGCGDLNGIGLFLDRDGRDEYAFHTLVNGGALSFGLESPPESRRRIQTAGLFLDLGQDPDRYGREGLSNGKTWSAQGPHEGMKCFGMDDG